METGTHMDLAELSRLRPKNYSALLNNILASPAEIPSPSLASNDFPLLASTTHWSIDQRFADLEARLFERQEKISETLRLMTRVLDTISKSVHVKQQAPTVTPPTKPSQSHLRFALPQPYDGSQKISSMPVKPISDFDQINFPMTKRKSSGP